MSFELKDPEFELGHTSIENIFIDEFLPHADGRYVKVFILAYRYASNGKDGFVFTHDTIAKRLKLPLSEVLEAWDYWEKHGVIEKRYHDQIDSPDQERDPGNIHFDVIFCNLTELYIDSIHITNVQKQKRAEEPAERRGMTTDRLVFLKENPVMQEMFKEIDKIARRELQPNEKLKIAEFYEQSSFDSKVIVHAFHEAAENRGRSSVGYVIGILNNWGADGIRTIDDLMSYYKSNSNRNYVYGQIKAALGSPNRYANLGEKHVIDKWLDSYGFDLDIVLKACESLDAAINASVRYLDTILTKWYSNGVHDLESAAAFKEKDQEAFNAGKEKAKSDSEGRASEKGGNKYGRNYKKSNEFHTKFHNFEQESSKYSEDELLDLWRNRNRTE